MANGGTPAEGDLRRGALARYDLHWLVLGTLAAVGLWVVGGVRDPASWVVFFAVAGSAAWVGRRFALGPTLHPAEMLAPSSPPSCADEPRVAPSEATSPTDARRPSVPPVDRVDHLRALRHELRTPLNAVLGFADVLLSGIDGGINASQQEDLEIIRASGIRLRILLDSALDLLQLADGELRLDVERVDARELVRRAASEATQLWSNKRALPCVLPEGPVGADLDEARIRRSILVLADFLAMLHREASMSVALTTSEDHLAIEIAVDTDEPFSFDGLPAASEVLAADDAGTIRQWPVAVTSELVASHGGSLYQGVQPLRFLLRLPRGGSA